MGKSEGSGTLKRRAEWSLSGRPRKISRQSSDVGDIGDAVALLSSVLDCVGLSGRQEGGLLFLDASAADVASFDFSSLIGTLSSVGACRDGSSPADVYVPGAVRYVDVSKQVVLKEIIRYLGLSVYNAGIVIEPCEVKRGWIEMDIPPSGVSAAVERKKFYSGECFSRYDAMEAVCEDVINYLRKCCNVVIKDSNYGDMCALRQRAAAAELYSSMHCAILEERKSDDTAMRRGYADFVAQAKWLCHKFRNVIPVGCVEFGSTSADSGTGKVFYAGPRPPITPLEDFAFEFVKIINKASNVEIMGTELV